jgi:hypothetical protein
MFFEKTFLFLYFQSIKRRAPGEHATAVGLGRLEDALAAF